ncbi:ComEC/Rec2 family competence protein [uncultured Campylobacter sp.]|uniref:ComEC/Rec2 family competence protein n=1 Tax=uncultured Campylobacter sp. TaxID=218934 RepID=UPI00262DC96B|nr:ComEC/Rec2 family competence protein [uncultured Campylobacter sp.]
MNFFKKYKEFFILFFFCIFVFCFSLFYEYMSFLNFKESKHRYLEDVLVLQSYEKQNKKGRAYTVLKLSYDDFSFYTSTYKDNNISRYDKLNLRVINTNVSFKDYLSKNFYMPSYDINLSENTYNENFIISYFLSQHKDEKIKEFYGALFFALPISLELRTDVNYYGIAHLIAISGYHIGLIFSLCFFLLCPLYSFFQKRYFPYRNLKFDLSVLIFSFLLAYAYLIGFVPSYIRSLVMALFAFYLLAKNINLLNYSTLFFAILICISLFPQLLFSVGFFFSIYGVFFIFLYMNHFSKFFSNFINVILLNLWTFFAMITPVLYFFPLVSLQQLLCIPLSVVFVVFYPFVLFLHIVDFGYLLDTLLSYFFSIKFYAKDINVNFYIFISYILLSLLSIRFASLSLFLVFVNILPFILL